MKLAIVSDSHGVLRDSVSKLLRDCDHILHAGDIGKVEVHEALVNLAPVSAIRGNVDDWASRLPDQLSLSLRGWRLLLVHDLKTTSAGDWQDHHIIVSGHSHQAAIVRRDGKLWINPGSIGPRRFKLPITMVRLNLPECHGQTSRLRPRLVAFSE